MSLFPSLFGRQGGSSRSRRVSVNDRLDQYVSTVTRQVDEPQKVSYIIDKNYQVVETGPTPPT